MVRGVRTGMDPVRWEEIFGLADDGGPDIVLVAAERRFRER